MCSSSARTRASSRVRFGTDANAVKGELTPCVSGGPFWRSGADGTVPAVLHAAATYAAGMQTGELVPDFELPDQDGVPRRLSTLLADGPVVLFFYPAAMTPGCTKEACHFRDLAGEFAAIGAQPVGISADGVDKQKQFDEKES